MRGGQLKPRIPPVSLIIKGFLLVREFLSKHYLQTVRPLCRLRHQYSF